MPLSPQGFCSGVFELKLQEFLNVSEYRVNKNCCARPDLVLPAAVQECKTFFRICPGHQPNARSPSPAPTAVRRDAPSSAQPPGPLDVIPESSFTNPID
ncbi:delta-like protein A [Lates japonicus]|uniref:Delta-like protein A n=1 Tax=Lates japonicus TaxID=270547 RepID=A0AAD3N8Q0_LATJO|nr:delta-like protein A [Lates japonicus]